MTDTEQAQRKELHARANKDFEILASLSPGGLKPEEVERHRHTFHLGVRVAADILQEMQRGS